MTYIPQTITDNAQAQLSGAVNASSTTFLLKTGEGADYPTTINGMATSTGDANTLNSTGIQSSGVVVGDFIYNFTQDAACMVTAVDTDSVTTTDLYKTDRTKATWTASDAWYVRPFVVTATNWSGTPFDGEPTKMEKILFLSRSGDVLSCVTSTNRGYSGTTPQSFAPDDYLTLFVEQESFFNTWIALGLLFETKADDDNTVHLDGAETITGQKTFDSAPVSNVAASNPNELMRKTDTEALITSTIPLEFYEDMPAGFPYYIFNENGTPKARKVEVLDDGFSASQDLGNNMSSSTNMAQDPSTGVYLIAYTDSTVSPAEYNVLPFTIDDDGAYSVGTKLKVGGDSTAALTENMTLPYLCADPLKGKVVIIGHDYTPTSTYISYITTSIVGGVPVATRDTPTVINASLANSSRLVYHKALDKFVCIMSTYEALISVDRDADTWTSVNGTNWSTATRPQHYVYDEVEEQILYSYYRFSSPNYYTEIGRVEITGGVIDSSAVTTVATVNGFAVRCRISIDPLSGNIAVVSHTDSSQRLDVFMVTNPGTGALTIDGGTLVQSTSTGFTSAQSCFDLVNNEVHVSYSSNKYRKIDISSGTPVIGSQKTGVTASTFFQTGLVFAFVPGSTATIYNQEFFSNNNFAGVTAEAGLDGETKACFALGAAADVYTDLIIGAKYYASKTGMIPSNTGEVGGRAYTANTIVLTKNP